MRGKRNVAVFMLSPHGKMSPFQAAQMYALHDPNIFNIAIDGVFDDCQDIVKAVGGRRGVQAPVSHRHGQLDQLGARGGAGRVLLQGLLRRDHADNASRSASAVPSGNFGNILAGHVARQMGLPIHKLILATNENDVLDEFFKSGRYRVRNAAETQATSSPSMDISKASNFERFMFDLAGRDAGVVRALWEQVERAGGFDLAATPLAQKLRGAGFVSGRSTHADRVATIRDVASALRHRHRSAHGRRPQGRSRRIARPACRSSASKPRCRRNSRRRSARRSGRTRRARRRMRTLESLPQRFATLPVDAAAVKSYIGEHALA